MGINGFWTVMREQAARDADLAQQAANANADGDVLDNEIDNEVDDDDGIEQEHENQPAAKRPRRMKNAGIPRDALRIQITNLKGGEDFEAYCRGKVVGIDINQWITRERAI